ncbi:mannonate dehydratase, partial [Candidatus Latescibacterota bacterium]
MKESLKKHADRKVNLERRKFGKLALAGALGGKVLLSNAGKVCAKGNKWSATGLKLGVSHQRLAHLNEQHLNYLKQMGVEYLEIRIPSDQSSYNEIVDIRRKVEDAGLKVYEIMLRDKFMFKESALGHDGKDEEIKLFRRFIRDLGRAGIDCTTYCWYFGSVYSTGST